jgi:hypothetical protein
MASSLDPNNFPDQGRKRTPGGHDSRSLGPSDSSDSGSDLIGPGLKEDEDDALSLDRLPDEDVEAEVEEDADADLNDEDSDRPAPRRRAAARRAANIRDDADADTDSVVDAEGAGLGGGLDQAEESQLGLTDEEIRERDDDREIHR